MRTAALSILALTALIGSFPAEAQSTQRQLLRSKGSIGPGGGLAEHAPGRALVRFRETASARAIDRTAARLGLRTLGRFKHPRGLHLVALPSDRPFDKALESLRKDETVLYAEPDYAVHTDATPDDLLFPQQWSLSNTGQSGGTPGADIRAPEAWEISTGSGLVVIGVLDTGIDYVHRDLSLNVWYNSRDCNNDGIDDDKDGYTDDCRGIDVVNGDSDPLDDNGHGTHVAGTIAALGDNGMGVTGVAWQASLLPCKCFDATGSGHVSDAVKCLDYLSDLKDLGVDIVATNNSWGGSGYSQALRDAIEEQMQRGILFVTSAGNNDRDLDAYPLYPAAYDLPNVLTVAASGPTDALPLFTNVGRRTVHLAAPGEEILSTWPGQAYETLSGTSMAAPHVTGVVALLKTADPGASWANIRNLILAGGDALPGPTETITGKRLDAYGALTCSGKTLVTRLYPKEPAIRTTVDQPVTLSVLDVDCGMPAGPVEVIVEPGSVPIELNDEGLDGDQASGDGTFTATWTPTALGDFELVFPGNDMVAARVVADREPQRFTLSYPGGLAANSVDAAAIGDLNGDGRNDAVVTTSASSDPATADTLDVFYQDASGELGQPAAYRVDDPSSLRQILSVALGDLNGDGRLDAAVGSYGFDGAGNFVGVLLQAANGTLEPVVPYKTRYSNRVAIGDLNGDGRLDLLAGAAAGNLAAFDLFLQDASGGLAAPTPLSVQFDDLYGFDVKVADVSGDGLDDIVVLATSAPVIGIDPHRLAILRQKPGGGFDGPSNYEDRSLTVPGSSVAVGDLNQDGLNDIAVALGGNRFLILPYLLVFFQNHNGGFSPAVRYPAMEVPDAVNITDIDGDGVNDVITEQNGWLSVGVFSGAGNGRLYPYDLSYLPTAQGVGPQSLATGDLNGDGLPDILFADGTGYVAVMYNQIPHAPLTDTVDVLKAGSGTGRVISDPPGIDCGSTCIAEFDIGAIVTLRALPGTNSRFDSWLNKLCVVNPDGSCTLPAITSPAVQANFVYVGPPLTVRKAGRGNGTVSSDPLGISCGGDCSEPFPYGATVTLHADPSPPSLFAGWSEPCSTSPTCTVALNGGVDLEARFRLPLALQTPQDATLYHADDIPPTFTWLPGVAQSFKVVWSKDLPFGDQKRTSGKDWLSTQAYQPDPAQWLQILRLARSTGTVYWEVKGRDASGHVEISPPGTISLSPQEAPALLAPADGQAFSFQDPAPTLTWEPNHNDSFQVRFSWRPDLKGKPRSRSGKGYSLAGDSWSVPDAVWQKIEGTLAPKGNGRVYFAIFAKDTVGRRAQSSVYSFTVR